MPPVTGEPQLGGEVAGDVANDEKCRPPDEIYEDDRMDTSSRRFPSASMSKSTQIFDKDSEQLGPFVSRKGKRKLDSEERYPPFPDEVQSEDEESTDAAGPGPSDTTEPHDDSKHQDNLPQTPIVDVWADSSAETQALDRMEMGEKKYLKWQPGKSEHTFQQQREWLVHGTWASIENVRKISSRLLVNKPQCEHIADHFEVTGNVLQKLGLGKGLFFGQALESSTGIQFKLNLDGSRFSQIAEDFDFYHFCGKGSRRFEEYICLLPATDYSSGKSLSKQSKISESFQNYGLRGVSTKELVEARSRYRKECRLDEFLFFLFEILKQGEALVLFHAGLEGANNGVVQRTGLFGEKFSQIHELIYKLLGFYDCLKHCEGTKFPSDYISRPDVCAAESILYYWNSNFLQENASLLISNNFLSIEMATTVAKMVKDPNCALKELSVDSWPGVTVDREELRKCRLMIIAALSESVGLTSLTLRGWNGKEVHELCKSLCANRVLENLVISTDGPLADNDAMDLSAMLKENHSLKSFTLEFKDVSPEGVVYLGAMLSEISFEEICLRSRGLRRFIKYLLGLLMAYIDGKRYVFLSLDDHDSFFEICRSSFEGGELSTGASNTLLLRIHRTLDHFSIEPADLDPDALRPILDFLRKNKTLQVLERKSWPKCYWFYDDNRWLEALFAENSSLRQLRIINQLDSGMISNAKFSPSERPVESIVRMLRTNKTLSHFSMINARLRTSDICAIVDSLKTNRALQVLHLECKVFDDPQVKVAFIDLLVNYNFTLSTINLRGMDEDIHGLGKDIGKDIEAFMKEQLRFDTQMALRELWSLDCTTSESPIANNAHDLKQAFGTLQLEEGEGLSKEEYGSPKKAFDKDKSEVEAKDERPQLLLSYSKEMRDFAMQLCMELKSSNYNAVDQDSINFAEAMDQCQLAIVVLSDMYVNSKPSMSELCTIVKSKRTNNPTLKVYPLFYKLTLQALQNAYVPASIFGGEGISLDSASEKEALNFLCEGKNEVSRKANDLVHNLSQCRIDVGKFCEEFSELQRSSWPSNGLEFEKNAISEEGYLHAILEEIFHYMPVVKECNNDQILGHQGKLEMESKLSLRQMKPLLETLPMTNFYLQRKFNMAQHLQEKYIQYSSFEGMCLPNLSHDRKHEYSKGRIVVALCPTTFLYHFKVHMFQGPHDGNFLPMLKAVADLVAQKMQKECNQNGAQTSTFFDFIDFGAPIDPKRTIAMCQNFSTKTSDGSKQLVIVQDDLTGAYYYQCVEAPNLGNRGLNESIGVIGVQVTSEEIHVDNIHEDGSSYSGVLGDFSYKFDYSESKQCASKAFGDLAGARFLLENSGVKCSPLLIIALASAIQKKGLTLTWSNGKGHMEFQKVQVEVEMEASACQIQYTGNLNQLGLEIEWGTGTNGCVPDNQALQRGTNEIVIQQMLGSNVDQSEGTSGSRDDGIANVVSAMKIGNTIALANGLLQNKITVSGGIQVAGTGLTFSYEKRDPESKQMYDDEIQDISKQTYAPKGRFHRIPTLDDEYPGLEKQLLTGQLHEVYDHNYLVVYNVSKASKARHISIYKAIEQNETVPKSELIWISDIPIDKGNKQIKEIFKTGLKGRELIVSREGSKFVQVEEPSKPLATIMPGYQNSLLKFRKTFSSNGINDAMEEILVPNRVGRLESKNEWVHIIGHQAKYEASYKYWWKATPMEAIVYSRTMFTSGKLLTTSLELPFNDIGYIGSCNIKEDPTGEKFEHLCVHMVSRGKFSRPPGSLLANKVLWGGRKTK